MGRVGEIITAPCRLHCRLVICYGFHTAQNSHSMILPRIIIFKGVGPGPAAVIPGCLYERIGVRIVFCVFIRSILEGGVIVILNITAKTGTGRQVFQEIDFRKYITGDLPVVILIINGALQDGYGVLWVTQSLHLGTGIIAYYIIYRDDRAHTIAHGNGIAFGLVG